MIRVVKPSDAKAIVEIYNYYILNTVVTFEESALSIGEMQTRITAKDPNMPWMVYEIENQVIGYAYASNWKHRSAYNLSLESTIYLDPKASDKGFGTKLYGALIKQLEHQKFHAIIGGISLPNEASIRLHEKLGFKKVAHFKEVGFKFNKWVDVGYWELLVNK